MKTILLKAGIDVAKESIEPVTLIVITILILGIAFGLSYLSQSKTSKK